MNKKMFPLSGSRWFSYSRRTGTFKRTAAQRLKLYGKVSSTQLVRTVQKCTADNISQYYQSWKLKTFMKP